MSATGEAAVRALYHELLDAWNRRDGEGYAACFLEDGEVIGFDGSQHIGRADIASTLGRIFASHPTPPYVARVRTVRFLTPEVAVLRAIAGMVPPGQTDIAPQLNAIQCLVAVQGEGRWRIALFQTTPAQFHGRPELVEQTTEELRRLL